MRFSSGRILTTHVGSLPRPDDLIPMLQAKDSMEPYDAAALGARVQQAVDDVVRNQAELGMDIVNDGEHNKSGFSAYTPSRLTGFEMREQPPLTRRPTRDALAFPNVYAEQRAMYSTRPVRTAKRGGRTTLVCTGPITYVGQDEVRTDVENLRGALQAAGVEEGFMTAIAPTDLAGYYANEHYRSDEEYATALADAMRHEYQAIVDSGLILQIDDPRLATHYDRSPELSIEQCRAFMEGQVELLNYALRGIPPEKVRYHTCYSVNVAPRVHDLELKHYVDLMLRINAGAYSIEAANPRHEHEWQIWQDVKLPEGKALIPGVVSHCEYLVEHPELVAQRIVRFACVVGRERVIASNDCGFATSAAGDEVHPDVAWAKLQALSEGARLASKELWGS
ncbi:MAG TPA: cobalamin-independent methionine synthase II family protein [Chloroflexota bacterium]|nr:cobalamin-independent methionine synthase II family protein [Chloroflexota bacterium]